MPRVNHLAHIKVGVEGLMTPVVCPAMNYTILTELHLKKQYEKDDDHANAMTAKVSSYAID